VKRIGLADTTFARVDMARPALRALGATGTGYRVYRRTVPGIKDLPSACQSLFRADQVDLTLALGMPGRAEYDRTCAHEASLGLQQVSLLEGKPILECFVFETEAADAKELARLASRRAEEHAENAWNLLFRPRALARRAGTGLRQGFADAGAARPVR
jgi:riboflavin synthase